MKRLLLILILTFSFQSWTKADDIRDFEIEGMSIGDSLLKYVSLDEIKKNMKSYPGSKIFSRFFKKFDYYDDVQFHFKTKDTKYIIHSIEGVMYFPNDLKSCQDKRVEVINEIKEALQISKVIDMGKQIHKNNDGIIRSTTYNSYVEFENGYMDMICYVWNKENERASNFEDSLKISVITKEFDKWLAIAH